MWGLKKKKQIFVCAQILDSTCQNNSGTISIVLGTYHPICSNPQKTGIGELKICG